MVVGDAVVDNVVGVEELLVLAADPAWLIAYLDVWS